MRMEVPSGTLVAAKSRSIVSAGGKLEINALG